MLSLRVATPADNERIDELFAQARAFMIAHGNPNQWQPGFPNAAMLQEAMAQKQAFVCLDDAVSDPKEQIVGVFTLSFSEPAYDNLQGGKWHGPNDHYAVIHRMACASGHGAGTFIMKKMQEQYDHIRIDTHKDNVPMCSLLRKLGFQYCGTVFYDRPGGGERVAFDWVKAQ